MHRFRYQMGDIEELRQKSKWELLGVKHIHVWFRYRKNSIILLHRD